MAQKPKRLQVATRPLIEDFPIAPDQRDPRIQQIKDELISGWEKQNGSSMQDGKLRPDFQEFLYGNAGKKIPSVDERAQFEFKQRFESENIQQQQITATPTSPSPTTETKTNHGRVSAMGVLAEIETIEPVLRKHQQETQSQLAQGLNPQIRQILPALGIKSTNEEQFLKIVGEVSQEAARQTIEDAGRIQSPQDVQVVVADSIRETISTHPELQGQLSQNQEEIMAKVLPQIQDVVAQNQQSLEQTAVLTAASQIASIQAENPNVQELVSTSVERAVEDQSALLDPNAREALKAEAQNYLDAYKTDVFENLTENSTLQELQEIKEHANIEATQIAQENLQKTQAGKSLSQKISYKTVTDKISTYLNLKNPGIPQTAPKLTFAVKVIASNPQKARELFLAGFAYDQETLAKRLKEESEIIENLNKKRALTHKEKKELERAQNSHDLATQAQAIKVKKPKAYQRSIIVLSRLYGRPELASQQFQQSANYFQHFMPRFFTANPQFIQETVMQSSGFPSSGSRFSSIFSKMRGSLSASSFTTGMGIAQNPAMNVLKKVRNLSAAAFGGLLFYFYTLGQAALAGFLAGAAVGATAGLVAGIGICVAMGPLGLLAAPIVIPLAMATGGIIGGVAGGLSAMGLASGSTVATTTGVGVATGGTTGAVIGGVIGFGIGGPIGALIGGVLGAYIGAAIGGAIGYGIGHYIISPSTTVIKSVAGGVSSGFGIGGFLSSAANFLTGLGSSIIGGISGAIGGTFGVLSGAANLLVGGLTSISVPGSAVLFLTAGPVAAVGVLSTIGIITTAASFATLATDEELASKIPGQNEFFTLTKTADKQKIANPPPDEQITFTITLTAKEVPLQNISIVDQMTANGTSTTQISRNSAGQPISPLSCPPTLNPGENCTTTITINATSAYKDSVISNTATAKTTPEGQTEQTESVTATVVVGTPPAQCPREWPAEGFITQGPDGATSHANNVHGGYEALDIAQTIGHDVIATVEGTVILTYTKDGDPLDKRIVVRPTACAGLGTVNYWHLSSIAVTQGQTVTFGQKIGQSGANKGAAHIHYQFNETGDRSFKIEPPRIPLLVPRSCNGRDECKVDIPPIQIL